MLHNGVVLQLAIKIELHYGFCIALQDGLRLVCVRSW